MLNKYNNQKTSTEHHKPNAKRVFLWLQKSFQVYFSKPLFWTAYVLFISSLIIITKYIKINLIQFIMMVLAFPMMAIGVVLCRQIEFKSSSQLFFSDTFEQVFKQFWPLVALGFVSLCVLIGFTYLKYILYRDFNLNIKIILLLGSYEYLTWLVLSCINIIIWLPFLCITLFSGGLIVFDEKPVLKAIILSVKTSLIYWRPILLLAILLSVIFPVFYFFLGFMYLMATSGQISILLTTFMAVMSIMSSSALIAINIILYYIAYSDIFQKNLQSAIKDNNDIITQVF